jgi:NAD-dependent dihydropyrimidine dehydrogenase PreA subunit
MTKILKVVFPDKCIGCELCVLEAQRQLKKVGLDGALVRIFREKSKNGKIIFNLEVDPRINNLEIEKIASICPQNVFEITEEENAGLIR